MRYARVSVKTYILTRGRTRRDGRRKSCAGGGARGGSKEYNNNNNNNNSNISIIQIITIIILFYYFESDLHADEPSSDVAAAVTMSASGHFSARFNANRTSVTALRKCLRTCALKRAHLLPRCPVLVVDWRRTRII